MPELVPELCARVAQRPAPPATFLSALDAKNEPPLSVRLCSRARSLRVTAARLARTRHSTAGMLSIAGTNGRVHRASLLLTRNFVSFFRGLRSYTDRRRDCFRFLDARLLALSWTCDNLCRGELDSLLPRRRQILGLRILP